MVGEMRYLPWFEIFMASTAFISIILIPIIPPIPPPKVVSIMDEALLMSGVGFMILGTIRWAKHRKRLKCQQLL